MTVPKIELGITDSSDFLLSRGITYAKPLYLSKCLVPKGLILRFAIELFKDCPKKGLKRSRSVSKPDFTQGSIVIKMINLSGMKKCYLCIELN